MNSQRLDKRPALGYGEAQSLRHRKPKGAAINHPARSTETTICQQCRGLGHVATVSRQPDPPCQPCKGTGRVRPEDQPGPAIHVTLPSSAWGTLLARKFPPIGYRKPDMKGLSHNLTFSTKTAMMLLDHYQRISGSSDLTEKRARAYGQAIHRLGRALSE